MQPEKSVAAAMATMERFFVDDEDFVTVVLGMYTPANEVFDVVSVSTSSSSVVMAACSSLVLGYRVEG